MGKIKRTLIRFTSHEYVKDFLAGKLYMSSLSKFWDAKNGFDDQNDYFEGTVAIVKSEDTPFPQDMKEVLTPFVRYRIEAYKYCNLLCFFSVYYNEQSKILQLPPNHMYNFGDTCIVIKNETEFINRINSAVLKIGGLYLAGGVNYHKMEDKLLKGQHSLTIITASSNEMYYLNQLPKNSILEQRYGCMDKYNRYAEQKEWRVCYLSEVLDEKDKILYVGNLTDIVEIVSANDISKYLWTKYSARNIGAVQSWPSWIQGNIRYNAFKRHVENIDGKCKIICIIT